MSDKNKISDKEMSAKMISEVLYDVAPMKYGKDYVTLENYDEKKAEIAKLFTEEAE